MEFDDENNTVFIDESDILKNCKSNRMFAYLTALTSDVYITVKDRLSSYTYDIDLSDYVNCNKCNILIIISRKPSNKEYPVNFIYITVTDYENNKTLKSGYITGDGNISFKETALSHNYYFYSISLGGDNKFEKFNIYTQNRTFGNEVIEATPDEDDGTYRVAHIAARRVQNTTVLKSIKDQLVNGEFIIDEEEEKLYLKINNKIINIGASSGSTDDINNDDDNPVIPDDPIIDTMEDYKIIQALVNQGLITVEFINDSIENEETKYDPSNIKTYRINNIGSVKFVHEATGKVYEYSTNAYGELESKLIESKSTLGERLNGATISGDFDNVRGLVGQLGEFEYSNKYGTNLAADADHGLWSDRIKIASIYAPLTTDVTYGCSHAYIELENTSDKDFNLEGCKLHFIRKSKVTDNYIKSSLDLTGIIPAGSTYLIRGKKYIENDNDSNCFIHVNSYDQEWYDNIRTFNVNTNKWEDNIELIDLTMNKGVMGKAEDNSSLYGSYVLILSYHGNAGSTSLLSEGNALYDLGKEITDETIENGTASNIYLGTLQSSAQLVIALTRGSTWTGDQQVHNGNDINANSLMVYAKGLIDALAFNSTRFGISSAFDSLRSNTICRGTYELDPAKQAYNSFTKRDSSRERWEKKGNDYQYLDLNKEFIEFPKSSLITPVSNFAPKASFEHKNVITDKTKFNKEKPNAVTVSYGENMYTTRCFNWLSASNLDEYIWIYDENGNPILDENNIPLKFESYKYTATDIAQSTGNLCHRKEFPKDINNIVYCDYRVNTVIDRKNNNKDVTYAKYATANRACGLFAGSNDFFVSHKCIIEFNNAVTTETKYSYIVGQADKYGNPIEEHCSERRYFTLYPNTYTPVIYQITDQQGFHWVEYQVWAAAAERLNKKIENEIAAAKAENKPIMPIILNTGDCTQSGSRVNEWLDYFAAGDVLFNHFEQNNLVGNNDLNGTDIQALGTGDDPGKSNGYYFYLFNCNEVNNFFTDDSGAHYPIVKQTYVPSLYYINCKNLRIVMVNSEITLINCSDWYNLRCKPYENNNKEYVVNIYTGYTLVEKDTSVIEKYVGDSIEGYTPLYTLLWHAFNDINKNTTKCIAACHEMPFTVITQACCAELKKTENILKRYRSLSDAAAPGKLIGSHMNQIDPCEDGAGVYWFSRLLEYSGVKLCIGGHKHTYAITYPLRENYKYKISYDKEHGTYNTNTEYWTSKDNGPMGMGPDLSKEERTSADDYKVLWKWAADVSGSNPNAEYPWYATTLKISGSRFDDKDNARKTPIINWSKMPITYRGNNIINSDQLAINYMYPAYPIYINEQSSYLDKQDGFSNKAVIYIMSQATGYKLTSNKELPTPAQRFSMIIPETRNDATEDVPDNNQKFPIYIKYVIENNICKTYLLRATKILDNKFKFTQIAHDKSTSNNANWWQYLVDKNQCVSGDKYILLTNKYDSKNAAAFNENAEYNGVYDNYGLWVSTEKQMISDIQL